MSGQTSEVIHCPNCKEDVPKTLYCLNCGYPLYKLEQQNKAEEKEEIEVKKKPVEEVDMSVEIEQPEPVVTVTELGQEKEELETTIEVKDEPEPEKNEIWEEPKSEEEELETTIEVKDEPEPEKKVYEETEIELEPEPKPVLEPLIEPEPETEIYIPEERESYIMDEIKIEFAPDPLTKEIMENLAKNITLKIRLVRLLRESQVKEETFKKLFDSYVDQGRLWISRRDEIIRRFKSDIARMEQELISARKDFELLEIRKNIGDANNDEYSVKSPAYKWDIENLDKEIKNSRSGIQYVINLRSLIPDEEVEELKNIANSNFAELDSLDEVTSETIARMKETLTEAINTLES